MKGIILTMFIFGMMPVIGQAAAEVTLVPSARIVTQGETFDLNISIDPHGTAIAGAQLNMAFNSTILKVNSITEGDLFKQNGADTFFNAGIIDNSTGTVINIFDAIIGSNNVSSKGTFIIINATAAGTMGTSWINLSNVKISDPYGSSVDLNTTTGYVRINSPPLLEAIGNKTVDEGEILTFTISAADIDGDLLTFSAYDLPPGAAFDPATRTFQWIPDYTQSGTYQLRFEVSDGILNDDENIAIVVNNVNRAPVFTSSPVNGSVFNETDSIQIDVTASDPDNDSLTYVIKIDGVQVSTLESYLWTTDHSSSGYHDITISVSDGKTSVNRTINIYINNIYPRYDINENGMVDIGDMVIIGQHFNEVTSEPYPRYDINMDGVVNILDAVIAAQHFGENT